jgi:anti-sigma regulatory factor (Ser/Thr protein kinase)
MLADAVALQRDAVGHVVQFYRDDDELCDGASRYLLDAVQGAGVAIVVSTAAHRVRFESRMAAAGVDLAAARARGAWLALDAAETMQRVLIGDRLDPDAFDSVVGAMITAAAATGGPVRVYGEMVALLWDAGQVSAAVELEGMWNELGRRLPFSLYCAYPVQAFGAEGAVDAFHQVCRLHSDLVGDVGHLSVPAAMPGGGHEAVRSFGSVLDAPGEARHFVAETLRRSGDDRLVDDAALLVTELATNAVVHTPSEFTVTVSRSPDAVRISVRDASAVRPTRRSASPVAGSGRGLAIVAAVSSRWDVEPLGFGKVVWAELRR